MPHPSRIEQEKVPVSSLRDSWLAGRTQRQQELNERRKQVQDTLNSFQQERQQLAAQLRDDLGLFQLTLRQNTQAFLSAATEKRQVNAHALFQELQQFAQTLRFETADLLSQLTSDRLLKAQELFQQLSAFRKQLGRDVAVMLDTMAQTRQEVRRELIDDLTQFVASLQADVQTYLTELEMMREGRAHAVWTMLQNSHDRRAADMQALFAEFAQFRAELQSYRQSLAESVWGTAGSVTNPTPIAIPTATTKPTAPSAAPAKPTPSVSSVRSPLSSQASQPVATSAPVAPAVVGSADATLVETPTVATQPGESEMSSTDLEQMIYEHIHQMQGARLPDIEEALGINRFQAVDALRALIKEGMVTQRDRVYMIQEEVSL
jgi:hypothetical protein